MKKAARYPHIKIVNPEWMLQCCARWQHVDEAPFIIELDPAEREGSPYGDLDDESFNASGDEEIDEPSDSPVTLDLTADTWASVDDELNDFLNETDTDDNSGSDSESIRSDKSVESDTKEKSRKRKHSAHSTDVSEAEESDNSVKSTSKLQRRKKRTMERVTSLTNVLSADKSSGLPSPDTTGPEEDPHIDDPFKGHGANGVAADLQDDYDDGLEAELLAGFGDSDAE